MVSSQRAQQSATFVSRPSTSDDTPTISHQQGQSTSTQVQLVKAPINSHVRTTSTGVQRVTARLFRINAEFNF
jgi:hypothetical protein